MFCRSGCRCRRQIGNLRNDDENENGKKATGLDKQAIGLDKLKSFYF